MAVAFTSGALAVATPVLLSPMEAVSDVGFRALCFRLGAGFTYTEMIRAQGIARRNKSTLDLIDTFDPNTPTGLQLLVAKPQELLDAVRVLEDLGGSSHPHFLNITAIDLNFGCPSPDVVRMGAGPALLKRKKKLGEIFSALQHIRKTSTLPLKSVSVKIRLGLNEEEMKHKVYLPVVEMANDTVDHIVVHARHAKQRSRDLPTWAAIGEAKAAAKIPVVGNGNVVDQASLTALRTETGCDAVMVARAAIKNPWSLREMTGTGPATATAAELADAEANYLALAQQFHSKDKYIAFHRDNFARLKASGGDAGYTIPNNAHMR